MIDVGDRVVVNFGRAAVKSELEACEYGSYEDHIKADGTREEPYDTGRLHLVELLQRDKRKTQVYLQTSAEIQEFFRGACTGTFGLYHLRTLQRIYKQLAPFVDADTLGRIPYRTLGH